MSTVKHYHHHYHFSYTTSLKRHFVSVGVVTLLLILLFVFIFKFISPGKPYLNLDQLSAFGLLSATFATFYRLTFAYIFALILSIPLSLLITSTPKMEKILLPFFDVLQSIPVLAFFPIIVLVFIKINFLTEQLYLLFFYLCSGI